MKRFWRWFANYQFDRHPFWVDLLFLTTAVTVGLVAIVLLIWACTWIDDLRRAVGPETFDAVLGISILTIFFSAFLVAVTFISRKDERDRKARMKPKLTDPSDYVNSSVGDGLAGVEEKPGYLADPSEYLKRP